MPDDATPNPTAASSTPEPPTDPLRELLRKHDRNPVKITRELLARIRELEQRTDTLVPAGGVVLSADQAALWRAVQAAKLGSADDVTALVAERDRLKTEAERRTADDARRAAVRAAARTLGWDEDVLDDLAQRGGFVPTMREVEVTERGQTVKRALPYIVTGEGASETQTPLTDVIARDHAKYLPSLTAATPAAGAARAGGSSSSPAAAPGSAGAVGGVRYPEQGSASSAPTGGATTVDRYLRDRAAARTSQPDPFGLARPAAPPPA